MRTKTYSDLYNLVQALSGVGSFTAEEKLNILQFVNRRAFEAYPIIVILYVDTNKPYDISLVECIYNLGF